LTPQQLPIVQYPPYQQFQHLSFSPFAQPSQEFPQQGQQFLPNLQAPQVQAPAPQPMQSGATGAVRPKRKKKKQAATFPPAPVPPQQPIQPVVAPNFTARVPQPIPPLVQYAPTEQVASPSLAP
jgi:hypothetical protein